jgi:secondary thiamine-phosphate synthase enzyme
LAVGLLRYFGGYDRDIWKGREERVKERTKTETLQVRSTTLTEMMDVTHSVQEAVKRTGVSEGVCIIFVPHTTAAVTINENADPAVPEDIVMTLNKIVPSEGRYLHSEGNSPAHIKASLLGFSQTVFIESGKLVLGTWQGIFFCEFDGPRTRKVHIKVIQG